jgi:hypothetical protein
MDGHGRSHPPHASIAQVSGPILGAIAGCVRFRPNRKQSGPIESGGHVGPRKPNRGERLAQASNELAAWISFRNAAAQVWSRPIARQVPRNRVRETRWCPVTTSGRQADDKTAQI